MAKKKPVKKLTEAEKKLRAKKLREAAEESESENESETEHESEGEADGDDDADADHPDADKDVELIKKMIAQHLGDGTKDMSQEEMESLQSLGHDAYKAHQEMGKSETEAFKHAGEALKLAHHMSKKEKTVNEDGADDADAAAPKKKKAPPAKAKADPDAAADDSADDDESEEGESEHHEDESETKESKREIELSKKLLEAEGRIAALEASTKKTSISGHVDKKLKESKLPTSVTKRFREAAGEFKSTADFDAKWKVFLSGVQDTRAELDFGILTEKAAVGEDGKKVDLKNGLDFSACAE